MQCRCPHKPAPFFCGTGESLWREKLRNLACMHAKSLKCPKNCGDDKESRRAATESETSKLASLLSCRKKNPVDNVRVDYLVKWPVIADGLLRSLRLWCVAASTTASEASTASATEVTAVSPPEATTAPAFSSWTTAATVSSPLLPLKTTTAPTTPVVLHFVKSIGTVRRRSCLRCSGSLRRSVVGPALDARARGGHWSGFNLSRISGYHLEALSQWVV